MRFPRSYNHLARVLALAACGLAAPMSAETYTWLPTAAGTTYNWNDVANWNPGTAFPNAVDDVANVNINIAGNQTINLNEQVTIGTLNLGDAASTYYGLTLNAGTAGSLVFQSSAGAAVLARNVNSSGTDVINANVLLNSDLDVFLNTGSSNGIRISGLVSGIGGINLQVPTIPTGSVNGYLELTNAASSYTGDTIVSNGILIFRGSVLAGQNSALGNSTAPVYVGSADTAISTTTDLRNNTPTQLRLRASNDTDNYVFERDMDFSTNTGTSPQNGRVRFALDGDSGGGVNTNTLTISGDVTLGSNGRSVEFLATREGQTIYFTGGIASGSGGNGTVFWGPGSPGNSTDGRNNGTIRFSDVARTYANGQNLTGGTMVIEGSVGAVGTASPIGTQSISLGDGNGGNLFSSATEGANRRLFMATAGTSFERSLTVSGGSGANLATQSTAVQERYGNSGSMNLMNGYEFGGLNTSGTVTYSANISAGNVNVPVTGTAAGAGGTNVITAVHNFALTAATGGTTVFSGIISGSTVPVAGSSTPGATMAANNARVTINQFRNHANLDTNHDGIPDANANQLVGTATEGTVVFTNANTYGGGTEVLGGTLLANNSTGSATGTGAVTVTAGALGGTGFITTTQGVSAASGAIIRPGDSTTGSGMGDLTLNSSLALAAGGGSVLDFQVSRTTSDINNDTLATNLNMDGTLNWEAITTNSGGLYTKDAGVNNDTLIINGDLLANASGTTTVRLGAASGAELLAYEAGMVWDLMDWTVLLNADEDTYSFEIDSAFQAYLTSQNLTVDTSRFWDTGYVGLAAVPEPGRMGLALLGAAFILLRRRRRLCA